MASASRSLTGLIRAAFPTAPCEFDFLANDAAAGEHYASVLGYAPLREDQQRADSAANPNPIADHQVFAGERANGLVRLLVV